VIKATSHNPEEIESLAGNAVNCRAAAAAWICAFSSISAPLWDRHALTAGDR